MINPILIIVIFLLGAFLITLLSPFIKHTGKVITGTVFILNLVIGIFILLKTFNRPAVIYTAGFKPPFSINLIVDPFTSIFLMLILFVGFVISLLLLFSTPKAQQYKFLTLLMLNFTGLSGMVMSGDIFNLFIFFEVTVISSCTLIVAQKSRDSLKGAINYFFTSFSGSTFFLLGIALLYAQTGTLNIAHIGSLIFKIDRNTKILAFLLISIPFLIESGIFPFNLWIPEVYQGAPEPVTALFSGLSSKVALYALLRITFTLFHFGPRIKIFLYLGFISFTIAELSALRENNLKRMLSYSSMGQMGLIVSTIGLGSITAIKAALFQCINHTLSTLVLFLLIGVAIEKTDMSTIKNYRGFGIKNPFWGFTFSLAILNLLGFPPFGGFWSKLLILVEFSKKSRWFLAGFILSGFVIETYYLMKSVKIVLDRTEEIVAEKVRLLPLFPLLIPILIMLILGLKPGLILPLLQKASFSLINRINYIFLILGGEI